MHFLRLKRGCLTEPNDVDAIEVTPLGRVVMWHPAREAERVGSILVPATPEARTHWFAFSALHGGTFEHMQFRAILLRPRNFTNNPAWSLDEMLVGSGPVEAAIPFDGYEPRDGRTEDWHTRNVTEGYLRYAL